MYDPPLSELETRVIEIPHNGSQHRVHIFPLGASIVVLGVGSVWNMLAPNPLNALFTIVGALALVLAFPLFIIRVSRICKCGGVPILTARERASFRLLESVQRLSPFKQVVIHFSVFFGLLALVGVGMISATVIIGDFLSTFYPQKIARLAVGISIPTGLMAGLLTAVFLKGEERLIPEQEFRRISTLRAETMEDFNDLIAFNLRIGNFNKADEFSRKLLEVLEQQR